MKIHIDADGCPVVNQTVAMALLYGLPCVIVCDTAHRIERDGATTVTVSQGSDSADYYIVNNAQKGDVVITQDYGLAAMCLSKRVYAINQDGREYTDDNISGLLEFRAAAKKIRNAGGRLKGNPKRTENQNKQFISGLKSLLDRLITEEVR